MGESLEILDKSAIDPEPSKSPLNDPSFGQHFETGRLSFDNFHGSGAGASGDWSLISGIAADLFDKRETLCKPLKNEGCTVAILDTSRVHLGLEDEPQSIHQDVTFAAFHFLAGIEADIPTCLRACFGRLPVDDGERWAVLPSFQISYQAVQCIVDACPSPVLAEPLEIIMHGPFRRELLDQKSPFGNPTATNRKRHRPRRGDPFDACAHISAVVAYKARSSATLSRSYRLHSATQCGHDWHG